jgi:hypothetical protein
MQNDNRDQSPEQNELAGDGPGRTWGECLPIRLAGSLSPSDVLYARRLAIRSFWPRVLLVLGTIAAFMILFGAIALSVRPYSQEASNRIFAAVIAIGPLLVALPYFLYRARIWRQWRRKTGVFSEIETTGRLVAYCLGCLHRISPLGSYGGSLFEARRFCFRIPREVRPDAGLGRLYGLAGREGNAVTTPRNRP